MARQLVACSGRGLSAAAAVGCVRGWSWRGLPLVPLLWVKTFPAGQLDMFAAAAAVVMGIDEGEMMPPLLLPPPALDGVRKGGASPIAGPAARRRSSLRGSGPIRCAHRVREDNVSSEDTDCSSVGG